MTHFARLSLLLIATCLPTLGMSLRILPWDKEVAERKLAIAYGQESVETGYLHPDARSKAIKLPQESTSLRLEVLDRLDDEGQPAILPLRIPGGVSHPLLLILPDKKAKSGLRTLIIEDGENDFRWGTIRLINVSPKPLVFTWDKKAKHVPNGWKPVDVSPGGDSRNMQVGLYHKEDVKTPLYTAVWEHREDMRQLVFVVPSSDTALGPYEFKFVPETRLAVEGE